MKYAPLDGNKIRELIADIQDCIKKMSELAGLSLDEFKANPLNYPVAEHYLRRSLEGILTIGTHIISRLPVKTKDYQDILTELGKNKIVPHDFAERNKKLAGYRNRIVHLYWEVGEDEIYEVIKNHLSDLDEFCEYFREVLRNPKIFNLEIEE